MDGLRREPKRERTPETPEHGEPVRERDNPNDDDSDPGAPYADKDFPERAKKEAEKEVQRRLTRLAAIESKVAEVKERTAKRIAEAKERTERALKRAMKKENADGKKSQQGEESSQSGSRKSAAAKDFR